jgi:hypothetical protein
MDTKEMSAWDFILPISCGIALLISLNLLFAKSYLVGSIIFLVTVFLESIRLLYLYNKDKKDAKDKTKKLK